MPKFILSWDCGYGSKDHAVVECENEEKAQELAYDRWRESAESNADYSVEPYSPERADELEIED